MAEKLRKEGDPDGPPTVAIGDDGRHYHLNAAGERVYHEKPSAKPPEGQMTNEQLEAAAAKEAADAAKAAKASAPSPATPAASPAMTPPPARP